jgi:hypothetical protein
LTRWDDQNVIYLTINAPDIVGEADLNIKPTEISFSAKTGEYVPLPSLP